MSAPIEVKEHSFGETIGTSLKLVFSNVPFIFRLLGFFALIGLAFSLLIGIGAGLVYLLGVEDILFSPSAVFIQILMFIVMLPLIFALAMLLPVILVRKFSRAYLEEEEDRSIRELLRDSKGLIFPLLGAGFLMGLGVLGGYLLLIIPGIIFAIAWSQIFCVVILERRRAVDALRRSWEMTKGYRWTILGLNIIIVLIYYGLYFGVTMLSMGIVFLIPSGEILSSLITLILTLPLQMVYIPLQYALMVVIYYNLRIKKEGFTHGVEALESAFRAPQNDPEA